MFGNVLLTANWVFIGLLILSVLLLIYKIFYHVYALMPARKFKDARKNHKFAILVPARYESAVLAGLLQSLKNQDYPKELFDVYVILESRDDPSYKICQDFEVNAFIRPNLDVKTKGGALDQVLKCILKDVQNTEKGGYEAFFIFDADNILKENFLTEMNKCFDEGYDIALAHRNSKNWNDGWVASCSALTFSMVNTFQNKCRARFNQNVIVSGTGFYIRASVIEKLGGWPFQTLTEDYEISNYAVLNNLKGAYNENTEFFDEQPITLKASFNQRVRWCKGHKQVTKKYTKTLIKESLFSKENKWGKFELGINVIPVMVPLASVIAYCIFTLVMGFVGLGIGADQYYVNMAFINFGCSVVGIYLFLVLYSLALVLSEKKHSNLTLGHAITTIFMNPFFMALWVPIYVTSIFKRDIKWKRTEHSVKAVNN